MNRLFSIHFTGNYARHSSCAQVHSIYVAQETYFPGDAETDTFDLQELPGIALYGGFPTGGCDFSLRNPKRYQTTLSGKIDDTHRNKTIMTMGNNTLLDGFTVTQAGQDGYGIYALGVDFTVAHSRIERNEDYGLYAENGNLTVEWTTIRNNKADGIYHQGEGFELTVSNCWIRQSGQNGIFCQDSTPFVSNSVVTESDTSLDGRAGIMLFNPSSTPRLHNLTIAHNKTMGVGLMGSRLPEIRNSIVYHNGAGALVGFSADDAAHYSCIEDCNSINNNINVDPELSYFDPNNVRIAMGSPCHDSGLTVQEHYTQFDMDNRFRVLGVKVDRGAYEIDCEDTSNIWDWNADGLVNYDELNGFSKAWMTHDPNDPAWADPSIADPNLSEGWYDRRFYQYNLNTAGDSQYCIDLADLMMLVDEAPWLWKACYVTDDYWAEMQTGGDELMLMAADFTGPESLQAPSSAAPEPSIDQKISDLQEILVFLVQVWLNEPDLQHEIDAEAWQEFMVSICQELADLQAQTD